MALQQIGRPKFSGEPAPAILVNATMALPLVGFGIAANDLLGAGELRVSTIIMAGFLLANLALCYLWSRVQRTKIMSKILLATIPMQWGWIGAMALSVMISNRFTGENSYFVAIFAIFAAAGFVVTRSSLKKPFIDSGFLFLGVAIMAGLIWHGVSDWSMSGYTAFSRGTPPSQSSSSSLPLNSKGEEVPGINKVEFSKGSRRSQMQWSYAGESGPDMWGALAEANAACSAGHEQAPVDIPARTIPLRDDLKLDWAPETGSIVNDGRIILMTLGGKSQTTISGQKFTLKAVYFHSPSEHQVSGFGYPMEVQFVHESSSGQIAVVAAFVEVGVSNPEVATVISVMPSKANSPAVEAPAMNFMSAIPQGSAVYRYRGSLTTPPCSEHVVWSILEKPIPFSKEQISAFRVVLPSNARPVQSLGLRTFESRESAIAH